MKYQTTKPFTPAPRPEDWQVDGREIDLLHYIYSRSDIKLLKNSPQRILTAIDDYNAKHNWLMTLEKNKGQYIAQLIADHKPSSIIELGGYVGYSAIFFGEAMRSHGGKFISVEHNPELAAIASQLLDLAGLRDVVQVVIGSSQESLLEIISEQKSIQSIDFLFMDHWKKLYLPDLWLLEGMGALVPGQSVIVADNVLFPGTPEYLAWVNAVTSEKVALVREMRGEIMTFTNRELTPDPGLVYETVAVEFDTPLGVDAVAVSKVTQRLSGSSS